MRNDDEEERHERKMIWLARGIIFLAVAWFLLCSAQAYLRLFMHC